MCDKCMLVDKALHGGLAELSTTYEKPIELAHNGGFYIIITNPTAPGFICIDRAHGRVPLQLHIDAMVETAEAAFPNHRVDFRIKSALEHFCFYIRPRPGAQRARKKPPEKEPEVAPGEAAKALREALAGE